MPGDLEKANLSSEFSAPFLTGQTPWTDEAGTPWTDRAGGLALPCCTFFTGTKELKVRAARALSLKTGSAPRGPASGCLEPWSTSRWPKLFLQPGYPPFPYASPGPAGSSCLLDAAWTPSCDPPAVPLNALNLTTAPNQHSAVLFPLGP